MKERWEKLPKNRVEMGFAGDRQVIANIIKKSEQMKTVLVCPGGGQRGVVQGGMAIGLKKAGAVQSFDHFVGVSAGAGCAYYTLANEPEMGTEIYYQENIHNRFVSLHRLGKIMDIAVVEKVFRQDKPVNLQRFFSTRSSLLVGVTDLQTGQGQFFDAKSFVDPVQVIIASMSDTRFNGNRSVAINGRNYIDGQISNPLPISFAVSELGATDILVLMTSPIVPKKRHELLNAVLSRTLYRQFSPTLREALASYETRYNQELGFLTGERKLPPGVRVAAIYPKVMPISKLTMNSRLLQEGAIAAAQFTEQLFSSTHI